jgi:hypothetical protein
MGWRVWKTTTFVVGFRLSGYIAPVVLDEPMTVLNPMRQEVV